MNLIGRPPERISASNEKRPKPPDSTGNRSVPPNAIFSAQLSKTESRLPVIGDDSPARANQREVFDSPAPVLVAERIRFVRNGVAKDSFRHLPHTFFLNTA
tara:strand:- start:243 stop:545 length:303 start_codon:yes stop_codon:yes gene_type:complete